MAALGDFAGVKYFGIASRSYLWLYLSLELLVLWSCFSLMLNVLGTLESRLRLLAIGAVLALIGPETVYYNLGRHADMTDGVNMVRGGLVLWLGFMMVGIW